MSVPRPHVADLGDSDDDPPFFRRCWVILLFSNWVTLKAVSFLRGYDCTKALHGYRASVSIPVLMRFLAPLDMVLVFYPESLSQINHGNRRIRMGTVCSVEKILNLERV